MKAGLARGCGLPGTPRARRTPPPARAAVRPSLLPCWSARAPQSAAAAGGAGRAQRALPARWPGRQARREVSGGGGGCDSGGDSDSGGRSSRRAPSPPRARLPPPLRRGASADPRAHGRAPRTIAAAAAAAAPGARHGEAGEEGMRLQALPEEQLAAAVHRGRGGAR